MYHSPATLWLSLFSRSHRLYFLDLPLKKDRPHFCYLITRKSGILGPVMAGILFTWKLPNLHKTGLWSLVTTFFLSNSWVMWVVIKANAWFLGSLTKSSSSDSCWSFTFFGVWDAQPFLHLYDQEIVQNSNSFLEAKAYLWLTNSYIKELHDSMKNVSVPCWPCELLKGAFLTAGSSQLYGIVLKKCFNLSASVPIGIVKVFCW